MNGIDDSDKRPCILQCALCGIACIRNETPRFCMARSPRILKTRLRESYVRLPDA